MSKSDLRQWAKNERRKLNISEISENLVDKLIESDEYKTAKNIMIFYPLEYEVNLLSLLNDSSKNFYLPKIDGQELLCCSYKDGEELCTSCFKTKEPMSKPSDKKILDLIIVPALACDKNNYRLGYGGGFYDRFLKDIEAKKIVCLPQKFIVETVFPNEYDIPVDKVINA